jgi:hypothetical protein
MSSNLSYIPEKHNQCLSKVRRQGRRRCATLSSAGVAGGGNARPVRREQCFGYGVSLRRWLDEESPCYWQWYKACWT